jgi:hypothetical protein
VVELLVVTWLMGMAGWWNVWWLDGFVVEWLVVG